MRDSLRACTRSGNSAAFAAALEEDALRLLDGAWALRAHDAQLPPDAAGDGGRWRHWLFLGGRGAGKTRAGAEWVRALATGDPFFVDAPCGRIALVGETAADVRETMIEGVSGLLAVHPRDERPRFEPSRLRVLWRNGAIAQGFSAAEPDGLRGPQFDAAWCDELAKWKRPEEAWDNLQFALRRGREPRALVTTTPRPLALLRRLLEDPRGAVTRAASEVNAANLAQGFLVDMRARHSGTRLGRQELDGEIVEDVEGAFWTRAGLEACRVAAAPGLARVVVAVDPNASSGRHGGACGIVAAGVADEGTCYVLADATAPRATPETWAAAATALYRSLEADALVVEVNQGGDMVESVLRQCDPGVPVTRVRATRGKRLRAAPVAQLYARGRVRHVGALPALEDEMCAFGPDGLADGASPDRLDALVWALTDLALRPRAAPRMRGM